MSILSRAVGIALVGIVLAPAFTAQAQSLADKQYWDTQTANLKTYIDRTNAACGTQITFEWGSNRDVLKAKGAALAFNKRDPFSLCYDAFDSVMATCGSSADAKSRIQQKVKTVVCGYGDPRTVAVSGGKMTLMNNPREMNTGGWLTPQLATLL